MLRKILLRQLFYMGLYPHTANPLRRGGAKRPIALQEAVPKCHEGPTGAANGQPPLLENVPQNSIRNTLAECRRQYVPAAKAALQAALCLLQCSSGTSGPKATGALCVRDSHFRGRDTLGLLSGGEASCFHRLTCSLHTNRTLEKPSGETFRHSILGQPPRWGNCPAGYSPLT